MKMCIAEKPSVAKEIAHVIGATVRRNGYMEGNGYCVTWTFGHLCSLQEPNEYTEKWKQWNLSVLPMIPSKFRIKLIDDEGIKKQFAIIEELVSKAEMVINCGDAGQEGELIQRWVLTKAKCNVPVKRLWISSLTEEAIREGFDKLMESKDFDTLYAAGSARAIGDWLLGMNATRAYTLKYGNGKNVLSIGRVQTPTLALVVERQKNIENFKPETYWEIRTDYRGGLFSYTRGRFNTKAEAEALLEKIQTQELEILSIERKKAMESPPKLFDLTLLQVECNRKYAFTADNTLKIIQSLYEKKLTTYPRVDTNFLPNDQYAKVPGILKGLKPYENLVQPILTGGKIKKSSKVFNDKKITDHHAIIPTGVFSYDMSPDEKRVYDLVARRFIAAFYPDCEIANTTVMAKIGEEEFKATGKQIIDPAWRVVFGVNTDKQNDENVLPVYEKGEHGPHTPEILEKETQPPKYYTEADLLRAMETAGKQVEDEELRDLMKENGIGRPSTRAGIIETLQKRHYIRKDKKRLLATPTGIELIDTIQNDLLKSAELTGQWEKKLRMIEDGKYEINGFMEELKVMVNEIVHRVKYASAKTITVVPEEEEKKKTTEKKKRTASTATPAPVLICPKCGQGSVVKGKTAWGCTLYRKSCDFLIPLSIHEKKLTQKQIDTLIQKGKTGTINGFKDEAGNSFNGILKLDSNYQLYVERPKN
ncbi:MULTISPECIES: type IA DNA topoisomerase [Odoribacteraceae]|jgi:DNA topoisomerase-3|uniref:type IA DNA topoisomerase n=1 Tax=Culturomica massiliensis TaxID=1841857 RepID=UPI0003351564|nr:MULTISPECIES: type IA DNA topoisomerase [Odoribacteraceae]RHV97630.1 type IA DNA topoisomerase [Odoribacter sp. OF09-27XD]CCZ07081.1 dNA topoisomerase III [Odoribacter sp. CAG:788]